MEQGKMDIEAIVQAVLAELNKKKAGQPAAAPAKTAANGELVIDLPDPTLPEHRFAPGVKNPYDLEGLRNQIGRAHV